MIKILLLNDKEKIAQLCKNDGVENSTRTMCYFCDNKGEELGYCIFEKIDKCLQINSVFVNDVNDNGLFDGLIRSVLGYARENSIKEVSFHDNIDENKLIEYGFIKDCSIKHIIVDEFLMKCKKC